MDSSIFAERRKRLAGTILEHGGGVAILATAPEVMRNADSNYPFRYDSSFYYLTAFPEPDAVVVIVASPVPRSVLFCRSKHVEREIWDGFRYGPLAASEAFGFDAAFPIEEIDEELPKLIANQPALYFAPGSALETRIERWRNTVRSHRRLGTTAPSTSIDIRELVDEMRLFKDASELELMRRAAAISSSAHRRAMSATRPGRMEYEVEAELLAEFRRSGSSSPAYTSIVAGGKNACVLHYLANDQPLNDGELLLIDAGCELDGYASDITRTFPINGKFSGPQRVLYELVLAAQAAAIGETRPGSNWNAPHEAATRVLAQGMIDLNLLSGTLDGVLESGSFRRFYMHSTGHWLGLDVHDVGDYRQPGPPPPNAAVRPWRSLTPGMVLTVEPGIYVRAASDVPVEFHDIGIRIEDDALVTADGCELLSAATPKSIDDIEAVMRD